MTSKKDLLEAQSFSRKRLLTAFISGAPGGKELEPTNPLRPVYAGVALAIMVVIGGLFYGYAKPGLSDHWENGKVLLVTDTGERFFTSEGILHPVINATSARLLGTGGALSIVTTDSSQLRDIPLGPAIGIVGAPDDVPAPDQLIPDGWTACPVADGTAVSLPGLGDAKATDGAVLVSSGDDIYVVNGSTQYLIDPNSKDQVLRAIGLDQADARPVTSTWLNLFSAGSTLEPFVIDGYGNDAPGTDLPVGSLIPSTTDDGYYIVTSSGTLAPLSPFAYELYQASTVGHQPEVTQADAERARGLGDASESVTPDDWPDAVLAPLPNAQGVCAELGHDEVSGVPTTGLATANTAALKDGVSVALRGGALVAAGGEGDQATRLVFVVDENGTAFAVPDSEDDPLTRLGYAATDVSPVSTAWIAFFGAGPALTVEAAGATPTGEQVLPGNGSGSSPSPTPSATPTLEGLAADAAACATGPMDYSAETPAALNTLQSDLAWQRATGAGVVVAVVDTGIDGTHPQLAHAIVGGVNLVPDGARADGLIDTEGHGTAIAGIISAQSVDGSGVKGLAPGARLLSVRVVGGTDKTSVDKGWGPNTKRLAEGIRWAADHDANVINVSMSLSDDDASVRDAVTYAQSRGSLIVAAAGNRTSEDLPQSANLYPASYPGVLATTAVDAAGNPTAATYTSDHIAIAAPGEAVLTTHTGGGNCAVATSAPASSFATAYISAAAALVEQAHPTATADQVEYRLTATATRVNRDASGAAVGWGVVQPFDAMSLVAGADERGPDNPIAGTEGRAVPPATVALTTPGADTSADAQREALAVLSVVALAGIGIIAAFTVVRRRKAADVVAARVPTPSGLLDRGINAATHVLAVEREA